MVPEVKQKILKVCGHCYRPLDNSHFTKGRRICKECDHEMRTERIRRCREQMKNPNHPSHGSPAFARAGCQCESCQEKMREILNRDNKTRRARKANARFNK